MQGTELRHVNRQQWGQIAPAFKDYNYRQMWEFGVACAERKGAISEHVVVREGDDVIACADVRVKRIPFARTGIAYINGGPLVRQRNSKMEAALCICLNALIEEYVRRRGMVLRICPVAGEPEWNGEQVACLQKCGFAVAEHMRKNETILLAIDCPLEDIRSGMHQKWRNCLNSAEKQGQTVVGGQGPELFVKFNQLYAKLIDRKNFAVDLEPPFYQAVQEGADVQDRFYVSLVRDGERAVAGHVSSMLGDTCVYLLGASDESALKTKASYLLQWHVIKIAREKGCAWYDLGGIDREKNPGVYQFKSRMGGIAVQSPGLFETGPSSITCNVVRGSEWLYRKVSSKRWRARND